jgi:hypothetical protein
MPTVRIPLVGSFDQRSINGNAALAASEDQRFLNCTFNGVQNPVTGKARIFAEKRPGWSQDSVVSTGIASTGLIKPQAFDAPLTAYGEVSSNIYVGGINVGVIPSARALHFTETLVSASSYVLIRASDGTGWYYPDGAKTVTSYTGDTISGDFRVTTGAIITDVYSGQLITGPQIGAGARVTSVNYATSTIGLSVAASATSTGAVVTKEPIAKILSANFVTTGTYISGFAPMDGYHFYATDNGYVNNSDLNTVTTYGANSRLAVQQSPDPSVAVANHRNNLIVFGLNSKEVFQNAGLSSGSPLQRVAQVFDRVGCIDQRSVTTIENEIYFVATPYEGDVGIYRIRDLQAQRISTPNVDRIIGTAASNGAIYAQSFRLGGYPYASFTVSIAQDGPSSNLLLEDGDALLLESGDNILLEDTPAQSGSFLRKMVYNIGLNLWSEWDDDKATFIDSIGTGTNNQLIATSRFVTSGKIYKIDPTAAGAVYQDDGATISTEIRTSKIDFGTNDKKYVESVDLIADTVTSAAASTVALYWSDDDYGTWKGPLYFDLTQHKKSVHRLGAHHDGRAYRLLHTANGPFRAEAIEITYRKGLS